MALAPPFRRPTPWHTRPIITKNIQLIISIIIKIMIIINIIIILIHDILIIILISNHNNNEHNTHNDNTDARSKTTWTGRVVSSHKFKLTISKWGSQIPDLWFLSTSKCLPRDWNPSLASFPSLKSLKLAELYVFCCLMLPYYAACCMLWIPHLGALCFAWTLRTWPRTSEHIRYMALAITWNN